MATLFHQVGHRPGVDGIVGGEEGDSDIHDPVLPSSDQASVGDRVQ
jgi:hypothetical protein